MKKSTRIIVMVLVVVMVLAVASTALASSQTHSNRKIYGGPSQSVMWATRDRSVNIEARVDSLVKRSQSNWRMRGYSTSSGTACTVLSPEIVRTGNWLADFTSYPSGVNIKMSIASSSSSDYLIFSSGVTYC